MPLVKFTGVPKGARRQPNWTLFAGTTLPGVIAGIEELKLAPWQVSVATDHVTMAPSKEPMLIVHITDLLIEKERTQAVKQQVSDAVAEAVANFLKRLTANERLWWREEFAGIEVSTRTLDPKEEGVTFRSLR